MSVPMTPDRVRTDVLQPGDQIRHPHDWTLITVSSVETLDSLGSPLDFHNRKTDEMERGLRVTGTDTDGETAHVDCAPSHLWHREGRRASTPMTPVEDPHDSPLHHSYALGRDLPEARESPTVTAERWNAQHPVGTPVTAYPGCRPEDDPKCTRLVTRTRSAASVLGGHTAVVWVDGHDACISLTHVDPHSTGGAL